MPRSKYTLGGREFPTKESVAEYVRKVRSDSPLGDPINDPVVLELLRHHPDWQEKSAGMAAVSTSMIKAWPHVPPAKEIVIVTQENSIRDISWKKCLRALPKPGASKLQIEPDSRVQAVRKAARYIVQPDIVNYRQSGKEVDHIYPRTFDWLFADWLAANKLSISEIELTQLADGSVAHTFADDSLAASWREHHKAHARLRAVSKETHQSLPKLRLDWEHYA